jgi:hypothetical protein
VRRDFFSFLIEGNASYEGKTLSFLHIDFLSANAYG